MIRRALWGATSPARAFLSRHKRASRVAETVVARVPVVRDAVVALATGDSAHRYQDWIARFDTFGEADLEGLRTEASMLAEPPLLSLVVPLAHARPADLQRLVQSLEAQVHREWEARFVAGPTMPAGVEDAVAQAVANDARLRPPEGGGRTLAKSWNDALRASAGEYAVLVEPGLELAPHALHLVARTLGETPDAVLVYADEDAVDESGVRSTHYFKPQWNPALFCSQNYLGGFVCFRRSLALATGGCRDELDDDCAWGLFLRLAADAGPGTIHRLPFVLSHRTGEGAAGSEQRERVARALERRLAGLGQRAEVVPVGDKSYRTRYASPEAVPLVSIVVPTTCDPDVLRPCLEGVLRRTSYGELEVLLATNNVTGGEAARRLVEALGSEPRVRVLDFGDGEFNFSRVNNASVEQARGELVCFLNDDTEVITNDWLSAMVAQILHDRVAAVGAMLFYPNDRIQHAGVVLGAGGIAAHAYEGSRRGTPGYHERALVAQDVSCVTAACMLVRRDVFASVGGFEETLGIAFNDVDLCLRLTREGWRIVWTPNAELYHREWTSIGRHDVGEWEEGWTSAFELMRSRWGDQLDADPHYSPNLSLDPLLLWQPSFPPRVSYPWRAETRARERTEAA